MRAVAVLRVFGFRLAGAAVLLAALPPLGASEGAPEVSAAERAELQACFEKLAVAYREDRPVLPFFDFDRMLAERKAAEKGATEDDAWERAGLVIGICIAATQNAEQYGWEHLRLERVQALPGGRAVVYLNARDHRPAPRLTRWWMHQAPQGWRIYDFEDRERPIRLTEMLAAIQQAPPDRRDAIDAVLTAQAEADGERYEDARNRLKDVKASTLPRTFEALHAYVHALALYGLDEAEAAMEALQPAVRLRPDWPRLWLLLAQLCTDLNRPHEAAQHARTYLAAVGPHPEGCYELGYALAAQGLAREAAEAYREGLRAMPDDADNLFGLARVLPAEALAELGEWLGRMEQPELRYEGLCEALLRDDALDALDALAPAFRKLRPEHPDGAYYEAQVLLKRERFEPAAKLLREAWPRVDDETQRSYFVDAWLEAMAGQEKHLEAYADAPDEYQAFAWLAGDLVDRENAAALHQLVKSHALRDADDTWLPYYEGEAYVLEDRFDEADAAYARGMEMELDEKERQIYLQARVYARFRGGKGLSAYTDLGRSDQVFGQLAQLCVREHGEDLLGKLIAERRKDAPGEPALARWEAELAFMLKDYARVLGALNAQAEALAADEKLTLRCEELRILSLLRLKRLDAALAEAKASTARDGDPYYEAIVQAVGGNVEAAAAAIASCVERGYDAGEFFEHADAGPALSGEKFAALRRFYFADEE